MKTEWDYSELALHYVKRPKYSDRGIDQLVDIAGLSAGSLVCDVGAGTGILTRMLLERGLRVNAVEPNDNMREFGIKHTSSFPGVSWSEGTGEDTKQTDATFDLVSFGSSFNVTDRPRALAETKRILKPRGWFACMWNHRDLDDPVQHKVERCIQDRVPSYSYGTRREDQTDVISQSGLFEAPIFVEAPHIVAVPREDYLNAWRSHATLQRQAGEAFSDIVDAIGRIIPEVESLDVPYITRMWIARAV